MEKISRSYAIFSDLSLLSPSLTDRPITGPVLLCRIGVWKRVGGEWQGGMFYPYLFMTASGFDRDEQGWPG